MENKLYITCRHSACLVSTDMAVDTFIDGVREYAMTYGWGAPVVTGEAFKRVILDKDKVSEDEFILMMGWLCRTVAPGTEVVFRKEFDQGILPSAGIFSRQRSM